jgi:hypothetical protein
MDVLIRKRRQQKISEPVGNAIWLQDDIEAPDQGVLEDEQEAPEIRVGRHREAPDAGEGRSNVDDRDFTHGRSQS